MAFPLSLCAIPAILTRYPLPHPYLPMKMPKMPLASAKSTGGVKSGLYALGRLRTGQRNKLESAYEADLERRKQAGEIAWYKFEGIKLRIADNCFLTVDFSVLPNDGVGVLEMIDVKGSKSIIMDDAKVKLKVAKDIYPFRFFIVLPKPKKDGGGWIKEEI